VRLYGVAVDAGALPRRWRVGELAEATGVTVRALHHYDDLGLLVPSERSARGYRLYSQSDVERLYRIVALRRLGFGLDEIASLLSEGGLDLKETVRRQLERVEQQLREDLRLRRSLRRMLGELERSGQASIDQLINATEETMIQVRPGEFNEDLEREPLGSVVLEEDGGRSLPIVMGREQVRAIRCAVEGTEPHVPMTHDLLHDVIERLGAVLSAVVVTEFRDGSFFAELELALGEERLRLKARPSDAIALAMRCPETAILVEEAVFNEAEAYRSGSSR